MQVGSLRRVLLAVTHPAPASVIVPTLIRLTPCAFLVAKPVALGNIPKQCLADARASDERRAAPAPATSEHYTTSRTACGPFERAEILMLLLHQALGRCSHAPVTGRGSGSAG
jgi:hypothetical protein